MTTAATPPQPCYPACGTARRDHVKGTDGTTCDVAHPGDDRCCGDLNRHYASWDCADKHACQHPAVEARACEPGCGAVLCDLKGGPKGTWFCRGESGSHPMFCTFECRVAGGPLHPAPAAPVAEPGLPEVVTAWAAGHRVEWTLPNASGSFDGSAPEAAITLHAKLLKAKWRIVAAPPPAPKLSRVEELMEPHKHQQLSHEAAVDVVWAIVNEALDWSQFQGIESARARFLRKPGKGER